jgi:peptidoglycan/LPS O-acetylase OafA/YrhL
MHKERVQILDSFRFIAVISVMLFHYTFRWVTSDNGVSIYPYGNAFGGLFRYGYLGVEFFFIISGFVISYTLENTDSLVSFCKKRFIRLFPPMLLCTIITFLFCQYFDDKNFFPSAHDWKNFLPSLSFINPAIWSLSGHKFGLISWSYWSLWPEIQFYIISAVIYFIDKKNFLRNMIWGAILVYLFLYIPAHFQARQNGWHHFFVNWEHAALYFDITVYILWFTIGVVVYHLYKGFRPRINSLSGIGIVLLLAIQFHACLDWPFRILFILMVGLFFVMIYRQQWLSFLINPVFARIGVISYSMYLIHEVIGIVLINKYGGYLGKWSYFSPFIMIFLVILFSELSFRFYEKKAAVWLKKILFRRPKKIVFSPMPEPVAPTPKPVESI